MYISSIVPELAVKTELIRPTSEQPGPVSKDPISGALALPIAGSDAEHVASFKSYSTNRGNKPAQFTHMASEQSQMRSQATRYREG